MIMNMNEKGRQTKLLAAIAVLAMVVCVLAAVLPSSTVDGANQDPATNMPGAVNGTITLPSDLTLDGRYYVESDVKAIDLGGHTLTAATGDSFAIEVPAGQTVSIDNGTIKADIAGINVKGTAILGSKLTVNAGSAKAVQILGGDVTVNGSTLTSTGDDSTVYIANNNDDNTSSSISGKLTFNSGTVSGGAYAISGNNMKSAGAIIDINGGTFSVKEGSTMSAIFIPMESTVSINNAEINGGIYVKMGNVTIDNSEITETRTYDGASVPSGDGGQTNGSAIIIGAQKYGSSEGQFINSADLSVTIGSGCTISSTSGNDLDVFNCKANTDDSQKTSINVTADLDKARIINDVVNALETYDAIDVALPSADTIIEVDGDFIRQIPDRSRLKRGQTPQAFSIGTIRRAYECAQNDPDFKATDDCGVVKKYLPHVPIYVVAGEESNMKLTYKEDTYLLDKFFQLRKSELNHESTDMSLLAGKVAVIFGGSYGIGAETARMLEAQRAKVYRFSRSLNHTDVGCKEEVAKALKEVFGKEGRIDFVVNTAGVLNKEPLIAAGYETIVAAVQTNYMGTVNVALEAFPYLKETKGKLVFFTSSSYTRGRAFYSIYSSTKAAIVNFVQAIAQEWEGFGIRVNCINPERTKTPMRVHNFGIEPEDTLLSAGKVAEATLQTLASDYTGQVIDVKKENV